MIYSKFCPILSVKHFDRSKKATFICVNHPQNGLWLSKEPLVSRWFPFNDQCKTCECPPEEYVLFVEYDNGRPHGRRSAGWHNLSFVNSWRESFWEALEEEDYDRCNRMTLNLESINEKVVSENNGRYLAVRKSAY